jgi:hypothetical protein
MKLTDEKFLLTGKDDWKLRSNHVTTIVIMSNNNNSVTLVHERTISSIDRRLSAKVVPTFANKGVSRGQLGGSPTAVIWIF